LQISVLNTLPAAKKLSFFCRRKTRIEGGGQQHSDMLGALHPGVF